MSTVVRPSPRRAGRGRGVGVTLRPRVPAVPPGLTRPTVAVLVVAVAVVALLAAAFGGTTGPSRFDEVADVALRDTFHAGWTAYALDGLVTPTPVLGVVAVLAGACLLARRPRLAVVAAVAPIGSYVVTSALKPLVGRSIHGANLSYPSGHAAYATALGVVVGLVVADRTGAGRPVTAALALGTGLGLGLGMAVDQVVLDAHYPTDTVGGLATGLAVVCAVALLVDLAAARRPSGGAP